MENVVILTAEQMNQATPASLLAESAKLEALTSEAKGIKGGLYALTMIAFLKDLAAHTEASRLQAADTSLHAQALILNEKKRPQGIKAVIGGTAAKYWSLARRAQALGVSFLKADPAGYALTGKTALEEECAALEAQAAEQARLAGLGSAEKAAEDAAALRALLGLPEAAPAPVAEEAPAAEPSELEALRAELAAVTAERDALKVWQAAVDALLTGPQRKKLAAAA